MEAGKWGFPGGFLDQGENVYQAILRELREETGFEGKINKLFRINSSPERKNDAGRNNVALEFLVEVGRKTGEPDQEQTAVEWKDIDSLNDEMMAFDHIETIKDLKIYLKGELQIPIVV